MLEPQEVARWERMTAAMLRHAGEDDPEAFAQVVSVLEGALARLPEVAFILRRGGVACDCHATAWYSWADIGRALGISRQAAAQRFRVVGIDD